MGRQTVSLSVLYHMMYQLVSAQPLTCPHRYYTSPLQARKGPVRQTVCRARRPPQLGRLCLVARRRRVAGQVRGPARVLRLDRPLVHTLPGRPPGAPGLVGEHAAPGVSKRPPLRGAHPPPQQAPLRLASAALRQARARRRPRPRARHHTPEAAPLLRRDRLLPLCRPVPLVGGERLRPLVCQHSWLPTQRTGVDSARSRRHPRTRQRPPARRRRLEPPTSQRAAGEYLQLPCALASVTCPSLDPQKRPNTVREGVSQSRHPATAASL